MNRRAQLAAWLVILVLGVGVGYVATVVRPFPEEESAWPLRVRYEVLSYPQGDLDRQTGTMHEFEGRGWTDWVDVSWSQEEPAEATVSLFDGRTANGVLSELQPDVAFATLEMVDGVQWQDVQAIHDQRRPPNEWFSPAYGQPPEPDVGREIDNDLEWYREEVADQLSLSASELDVGQYWQPTCEEMRVEACGSNVYRYRYIYHVEARVPLLVEEYKSGAGRTTLARATEVALGLDEGTELVVDASGASEAGPR